MKEIKDFIDDYEKVTINRGLLVQECERVYKDNYVGRWMGGE